MLTNGTKESLINGSLTELFIHGDADLVVTLAKVLQNRLREYPKYFHVKELTQPDRFSFNIPGVLRGEELATLIRTLDESRLEISKESFVC